MALYGYGFSPIGFTAGTCQWDLRALSGRSLRLLTCAYKAYNFQGEIGFGRPASVGTISSGWTPTALDSNDPACYAYIAIQWSVANTVPSGYFKRYKQSGSGYYPAINWVFPRGLFVPSWGAVCVWNIATVSASYPAFNVVFDE